MAATVACTGAEGPTGPAGGGNSLLFTAAGTGSLILDESTLGTRASRAS